MSDLDSEKSRDIETKTRLKKILNERGMTQKKLASLSDIGEYKISLLCSGKADNIQISTAKRICEVLRCTLDEAFGDLIA